MPVLFRLVAVDLEVLAHLQGLEVAGNAAPGCLQPGFFEGPDLEEGIRVVLPEQPILFDRGEPALDHFLPLGMALAGLEIQSDG